MSSLSSLRTSAASTSKLQPFRAFCQFMRRLFLDSVSPLAAGLVVAILVVTISDTNLLDNSALHAFSVKT